MYLPVLKELSSGDITELAKGIEGAWEMDRQRWLANIPYKGERAEDIESFLSARTEFLSSAWVDGVNYHNIRVYPADKAPLFFSVKDGENFDSELLQGYDCLWLDALSGKEYDFSQAVTDDVYLYSEAESAPIESDAEEAYTELENPGLGIREKLTVLSIIAMFAIFATLLTVDIRQQMQERRSSYAKSGKKISS